MKHVKATAMMTDWLFFSWLFTYTFRFKQQRKEKQQQLKTKSYMSVSKFLIHLRSSWNKMDMGKYEIYLTSIS